MLLLISLRAKPNDGFVADLVEMLASFKALLAAPLWKDGVVSVHHHCLFLTFWLEENDAVAPSAFQPSAFQSCFLWPLMQRNHREQ